MLQCALRYTCSCSREYLVAFGDDHDNQAWFDAVEKAADSLGLTFVGGKASFVCAQCGTVHVRNKAGAGHVPSVDPRID
ncbi:MAG TPA: hypothetical protein VGU02_02800 [Gaiellaceae bacterium]|nr:hypothetical protein [Gaiellaceae bacterium]